MIALTIAGRPLVMGAKKMGEDNCIVRHIR